MPVIVVCDSQHMLAPSPWCMSPRPFKPTGVPGDFLNSLYQPRLEDKNKINNNKEYENLKNGMKWNETLPISKNQSIFY